VNSVAAHFAIFSALVNVITSGVYRTRRIRIAFQSEGLSVSHRGRSEPRKRQPRSVAPTIRTQKVCRQGVATCRSVRGVLLR